MAQNLRLVDHALDTAETLVRGVGRISGFAESGAGAGAGAGGGAGGESTGLRRRGAVREFAVARTNWWGRKQVRSLRVAADGFERALPGSAVTKAAYRYDAVERVEIRAPAKGWQAALVGVTATAKGDGDDHGVGGETTEGKDREASPNTPPATQQQQAGGNTDAGCLGGGPHLVVVSFKDGSAEEHYELDDHAGLVRAMSAAASASGTTLDIRLADGVRPFDVPGAAVTTSAVQSIPTTKPKTTTTTTNNKTAAEGEGCINNPRGETVCDSSEPGVLPGHADQDRVARGKADTLRGEVKTISGDAERINGTIKEQDERLRGLEERTRKAAANAEEWERRARELAEADDDDDDDESGDNDDHDEDDNKN